MKVKYYGMAFLGITGLALIGYGLYFTSTHFMDCVDCSIREINGASNDEILGAGIIWLGTMLAALSLGLFVRDGQRSDN